MLATSTIELTIRMMVALAVLLSILYVVSKLARRHLHGRGGDRPHIDIQYQRQLTKNSTLSLVTAGRRNLLIATNNQAITLLAEGDDLVATPAAIPTESASAPMAALTQQADPPASSPIAEQAPPTAGTSIDIRSRPAAPHWSNPLKSLQNRTVRRG